MTDTHPPYHRHDQRLYLVVCMVVAVMLCGAVIASIVINNINDSNDRDRFNESIDLTPVDCAVEPNHNFCQLNR
jgi:hypothetical protein